MHGHGTEIDKLTSGRAQKLNIHMETWVDCFLEECTPKSPGNLFQNAHNHLHPNVE